MPLNKSKGNMYPWVTHTHSHLGGECPHQCVYCYVDNPRFGRPERYTGDLRLIEKEFGVNYGTGKTIFIEHCNDLFAYGVPDHYIKAIISHCNMWIDNTYVFQTKNPVRYLMMDELFPENTIFGTTIETNRDMSKISKAPPAENRVFAMERLHGRKFVTIEPVLDFDVDILASWIDQIRPEFLNLGADSKRKGLPEPTAEKIMEFVDKLAGYGIKVNEKHNLSRLKG